MIIIAVTSKEYKTILQQFLFLTTMNAFGKTVYQDQTVQPYSVS